MTSGVPQELVLGPLLFVICINDLDENVQSMISKFVDDTKIGGIVDNEEAYQKLQQDLDQLGKRTKKWKIDFNIDMCERDPGVQVHSSLKEGSQVDRAVKEAFGTLDLISLGIEYRSWEVMLQLYRTL
eukprot:g27983.t1